MDLWIIYVMSQLKNDSVSDGETSKLEQLEEFEAADFSPFFASFRKYKQDLSEPENINSWKQA